MSDHSDKIEQEGREAFAARKRLSDNPFGQTAGYDSYHWALGFRKARQASRMADPKRKRLTPEDMAEIMDESEWGQ